MLGRVGARAGVRVRGCGGWCLGGVGLGAGWLWARPGGGLCVVGCGLGGVFCDFRSLFAGVFVIFCLTFSVLFFRLCLILELYFIRFFARRCLAHAHRPPSVARCSRVR